MLLVSARVGELAQRIGPRIPLTVGPLIIAAGLLLMLRISPGTTTSPRSSPPSSSSALGLTFVVAPVTATVMAAVDASHSGVASGVNNAVARVAGLLAVAVLPVVAGLTGKKFYDPSKMTHGFHVGMVVCAALALLGAVVAWTTISSEVLHDDDEADEEPEETTSAAAARPRPCEPPATSPHRVALPWRAGRG